MIKGPCGEVLCRRHTMTLREFGRLGGENWGPSFRSKLGKAASKLYREIYGKEPPTGARTETGATRSRSTPAVFLSRHIAS
jgi:hypothetical protein